MQEILSIIQEIISFISWSPLSSNPNIHYALGPAVIPLITLALSAATTGYGLSQKARASKQLREAQERMNKKYQSVADYYDAEGSKDFLDTEVAQSTLGKIREQYKRGVETNASDAVRGGATAEAKVANKAALNEKYNDVLSNLVGYGTQYKSSLKKDYSNSLNQVAQGQQGLYGADVASYGNLASNAGSTFANTAGSTDWASIFGNKSSEDDPSDWQNRDNATY